MILEDKINIERKEAKAEGHKEGLVEGKIEVAKKMLARGKSSLEEIAEYTSLSIEEIQKLAKNSN